MDWTEFNKRFPTEESCRNYLFKKKWTDGFCCPKCECKKYWLLDPYKYKCQQCGYQSTITTGTVFKHTHLSMRQWFAAIEYVGLCGNSATASGLNTELKNIDLEIGSNRTRLNIMKTIKPELFTHDKKQINRPLRGKIDIYVDKNTNIITAVEVYDGKIDHIRLCELPEYTKKYYDEFILSNIKKGSILKRACGLYTVNSQIDGYITKFRGIESYNAIYARMVYEHFQTVTHEKPNEPSHYIENYCNYINAFTDSISFDELFDNMLNCKPRKNPRKEIIKQIRLTNGRMGK